MSVGMYWMLGLFVFISVVELAAVLALFRVRDLLHVVVLLTIMFIFTSLLYLLMSQPLLALLQILVMVGGVSTYLFIGTASQSFSKFKHTSMPLLIAGSLIIFFAISYPIISGAAPYSTSGANAFSVQSQSSFIGSDMVLFYIIALLLFGIGMGAIVLYRKIGAGKWR